MQHCDSDLFESYGRAKVSPSYISKRYLFIKYLSEEEHRNPVVMVRDNEINKLYAMKIIPYYSDVREIKIACSLGSTSKYTHSILIPQAWAIIDISNQGEGWISALYDTGKTDALVLILPLLDGNATDIFGDSGNIPDDVKLEIIVAIAVLHLRGLSHGDLHMDNILFAKTDKFRQYTINGTSYMVKSPYMPYIVDFETTNTTRSVRIFNEDWLCISSYLEISPNLRHNNIGEYIEEEFDDLTDVRVPGGTSVTVFDPITIE